MLINFYGKECPHCIKMDELIEKLKSETGAFVESRETWYNEENAKLLKKYDKGLCGGVPFLFNTENGKYLCGESSYEELKNWAGK